jgi:nucleoside-diphosphate-sugar epimerase
MKSTAIRHSNIYGPHDKFDLEHSHVFGATVSKTMTAERDIIIWGTGEEERDLLHVDDLVRFVEAAMANQQGKHRLYNCGLGEKISIKRLVEKIVAASGKKLEIKHDLEQPTIKTSLFLDNSKATLEIGWKPIVDLDQGITRTVRWWRDNIDPDTLKKK